MADPISIAAATLTFAEVTLRGLQMLTTALKAGEEVRLLRADLSRSEAVLGMVKVCLESRAKASFVQPNHAVDRSVESTVLSLREAINCFVSIEKEVSNKIDTQSRAPHDARIRRCQWLRRKSHFGEMRTELLKQIQALMTSIQAIYIADNYNFRMGASQIEVLPTTFQRKIYDASHSSFDMPRNHDRYQNSNKIRIQKYVYENSGSSTPTTGLRMSSPSTHRCNDNPTYKCTCSHRSYAKISQTVLNVGVFTLEGQYSQKLYCPRGSCNRQSVAMTMAATLYLAPWVWKRLIHLHLAIHPLTGINLTLRLPRTIEFLSPAMQHASYGNVNGLRNLFEAGLASPMDESSISTRPYRRTLISQAIFMTHLHSEVHQIEVIRLLIQTGADVRHELCQVAAMEVLQECRVATELGLDLMRYIVNSGDHFDDSLNTIERLVLGLEGPETSLEKELQRSKFPDPATSDSQCWTILDYAVLRGDVELLRNFLANGVRPRLSSRWQARLLDHYGKPAMIYQYDVFQELIRLGASIDSNILFSVMRSANERTVQLLIGNGADVHIRDEYGHTALHEAAFWNNVAAARLLLSNNASVGAVTSTGMTPLHYAAATDSTEFISLLARNGAAIDARDENGKSLLHYAAGCAGLAAVRLLVSMGADLDLPAFGNLGTPLHFAAAGNEQPASAGLGIGVIHYLLTARASESGSNSRAFDHIGIESGTRQVTGCVAAFLAHNIAPSCYQLLMAIETRNERTLQLLLSRKDLYDLGKFTNDQEKVFEAAAKHADSKILELLQTESWTDCSVWFGTLEHKTHYQDASYFLFSSWTLEDEKSREAFEVLRSKIRHVAFYQSSGKTELSQGDGNEWSNPSTAQARFQEILREFDAQDIGTYRSSPTGIWNLRNKKCFSITDPIELEHQISHSTKKPNSMIEEAQKEMPLKDWSLISDMEQMSASWLKCDCGLFVFQRDSCSWMQRLRDCKGCGKNAFHDLCTC